MADTVATSGAQQSILIVDDDENVRETLRLQLIDRAWEVQTADNSARALELFRQQPTAVALIGMSSTDRDRITLASTLRQHVPGLIVLLMAGYASLDTAWDEAQQAAHVVLIKPVRMDQLTASIGRAHRELELIQENQELRQTVVQLQATIAQGTAAQEASDATPGEPEAGAKPTPSPGMNASGPGLAQRSSGAIAGYERQMAPNPQDRLAKPAAASDQPPIPTEEESPPNG